MARLKTRARQPRTDAKGTPIPVRRPRKPPVPLLAPDQALPDSLPAKSTAITTIRAAFKDFETSVGGRDALTTLLLHVEGLAGSGLQLLQLIGDPAWAHTPLATLCADSNVSLAELWGLYRQALLARAELKKLRQLEQNVEATFDDIDRYCRDHQVPCPTCYGSGQLETRRCYSCGGTGSVQAVSSIDHQRLALELLGFLKKPGFGVQVNTQVNTTNAPAQPTGGLVALQQAVGAILDQKAKARAALPAPIVDADVVESPSS